jgi:hypothetical protein
MKKIKITEGSCNYWKYCTNHAQISGISCIYKLKIDEGIVECDLYKGKARPIEGDPGAA